VNSPTYLGGLWDRDGCATVDPARLAWGIRRACLAAGVRIYEHTPVTRIGSQRGGGPPSLATPARTGGADPIALCGGGGGGARAAAAQAALLPGPGLRLRADDQAA